ncbi:hypothetical protein HYV70_03065 [Candidatus Uhrbacteria bacterium]|nr:hypothetical protein [Candidatus Uhrbacteria bacterium]
MNAKRLVEVMGGEAFVEMMASQIGNLMKECARRVIMGFPAFQFHNEFTIKGLKEDGSPDKVSKADIAASDMYQKLITEQFVKPFGFGLIGEEHKLNIPCALEGMDIYFVFDPYDGTSALDRKQSHGIGTMSALVVNGKVVAVCIGDVNSQEMYYFRPGSSKTHRLLLRQERVQPMVANPETPLREQYLLLRSMLHRRSKIVQDMVHTGLFKDAETADGSIGISMARLWKGEVGGTVTAMKTQTPWDVTPVIGMNQRLGYVHLRIVPYRPHGASPLIERFDPVVPKTIVEEPYEVLTIHESRLTELNSWCICQRISAKF